MEGFVGTCTGAAEAAMNRIERDPTVWHSAGTIGVDAGLCWVGDPCYVMHAHPKDIGEDWAGFCERLGEAYPTVEQFHYDAGHAGLGVCVSTGYGDGAYPVEVRYSADGRVAELRVTFIGGPDPVVEPLDEAATAALDPGVRDLVVALRSDGFETVESGDGEVDHGRLDCPYVVVHAEPGRIAETVRRLQAWVDADMRMDGWTVEAAYHAGDAFARITLYDGGGL